MLREVRALSRMEGFRGTITDLGGPTANMYKMTLQGRGDRDAPAAACPASHPGICENLGDRPRRRSSSS